MIRVEQQKADDRQDDSQDGTHMRLVFHPLLYKDDDKHRSHYEIEPLSGERDQIAEYSAQRGTTEPVDEVEDGYPKHEPSLIDVLGDLSCVVDRKRLVAHEIIETQLFDTFDKKR